MILCNIMSQEKKIDNHNIGFISARLFVASVEIKNAPCTSFISIAVSPIFITTPILRY